MIIENSIRVITYVWAGGSDGRQNMQLRGHAICSESSYKSEPNNCCCSWDSSPLLQRKRTSSLHLAKLLIFVCMFAFFLVSESNQTVTEYDGSTVFGTCFQLHCNVQIAATFIVS